MRLWVWVAQHYPNDKPNDANGTKEIKRYSPVVCCTYQSTADRIAHNRT